MSDTLATTHATSNRLPQQWTGVIRWVFIGYTIMAVVLLAISALPHYRASLVVCDGPDCPILNLTTEEAASLEATGINLPLAVGASMIASLVAAVVFVTVAVVVYFSRPNEAIAVITAFVLVSSGTAASVDYLQPDSLLWDIGLRVLQSVAIGGLPVFLFMFPNGRLVPSWSRWLAGVSVIGTAVLGVLVAADVLNPAQLTNSPLGVLMLFGLASQVYRYFWVSTQQERQQAKWVVIAFGVIALVFSSANLIRLGPQVPPEYLPVISGVIAFPATALVPLAIMLAVLRYGLWDIDFYINRSLVYGGLTLLLVGVFAGVFAGLRALFGALFGADLPGVELVVATAAVVGLFNPARKLLRGFVDRRIYGIKLDYANPHSGTQLGVRDDADTETIGTYPVLRQLGAGGMGEVYASQDETGHPVAVKVLQAQHQQDDTLKKRFLREAQATASLEHPNIVKILEVGASGDLLYLAMEYIDGQDWAEQIKESGAQPLDRALPQLREVASALDYIHERGIIHRDIKPSNVMIEQGTGRAVLMDFGIAKIASEMTMLTGTSQLIGSIDYISPEQIQGKDDLDRRADVYSFAVMTYHILTGKRPFARANAGAVVMAHLMQPPPNANEMNPAIPISVADAIERGMAKHPDDRYPSVGAFAAALGV